MSFTTILVLSIIGVFVVVEIFGAVADEMDGVDNRTPEQKLMDTHIGDRVTTLGAALDAVNAEARGRRPKTFY